jgi:dihydroorotate dehydrogenase
VNIGKNQDTPLDSAKNDYIILLQYFAALADYLVINISSPNTIGLRRLQARKELENLLEGLVFARQEEEQKIKKRIPMLVKLAPDLSDGELYDAVDVITQLGIDGIVATNTSTFRDGVDSENSSETGGLSGRPLTALSTDMVRKIYSHTSGSLPIIGSGGVMNASDAEAKLDAGAVLIQVYTGLVYRGPGLVREILNGLSS